MNTRLQNSEMKQIEEEIVGGGVIPNLKMSSKSVCYFFGIIS